MVLGQHRASEANESSYPSNQQSEAIDVDIDEILDMDTDDIRRNHLIVRPTNDLSILHITFITDLFLSLIRAASSIRQQAIAAGHISEFLLDLYGILRYFNLSFSFTEIHQRPARPCQDTVNLPAMSICSILAPPLDW